MNGLENVKFGNLKELYLYSNNINKDIYSSLVNNLRTKFKLNNI